MRAGVIAHKGISLGADGYPISWHATYDQDYSGLSSSSMEVNNWYHVVMVVDRETGRIKQYLNGQLASENSFPMGRQGEISLGDWFFGGMPSFNDRFAGFIDGRDLQIMFFSCCRFLVFPISFQFFGNSPAPSPFTTSQRHGRAFCHFGFLGNYFGTSGAPLETMGAAG